MVHFDDTINISFSLVHPTHPWHQGPDDQQSGHHGDNTGGWREHCAQAPHDENVQRLERRDAELRGEQTGDEGQDGRARLPDTSNPPDAASEEPFR